MEAETGGPPCWQRPSLETVAWGGRAQALRSPSQGLKSWPPCRCLSIPLL